jgi:hypothetical protein
MDEFQPTKSQIMYNPTEIHYNIFIINDGIDASSKS